MANINAGIQAFTNTLGNLIERDRAFQEKQFYLDLQRKEAAASLGLDPNSSFDDIYRKQSNLRAEQLEKAEQMRKYQERIGQIISGEIQANPNDPLFFNEAPTELKELVAKIGGLGGQANLSGISQDPEFSAANYTADSWKEYQVAKHQGYTYKENGKDVFTKDPVTIADKVLVARKTSNNQRTSEEKQWQLMQRAQEAADALWSNYRKDNKATMGGLDEKMFNWMANNQDKVDRIAAGVPMGYVNQALYQGKYISQGDDIIKRDVVRREKQNTLMQLTLVPFAEQKGISANVEEWSEDNFKDYFNHISEEYPDSAPSDYELFKSQIKGDTSYRINNFTTMVSNNINEQIGGQMLPENAIDQIVAAEMNKANVPSHMRATVYNNVYTQARKYMSKTRNQPKEERKNSLDALYNAGVGFDTDVGGWSETGMESLLEDMFEETDEYGDPILAPEYLTEGHANYEKIASDIYRTFKENLDDYSLSPEVKSKMKSYGVRAFLELAYYDFVFPTPEAALNSGMLTQAEKDDYAAYLQMKEELNQTTEGEYLNTVIRQLGRISYNQGFERNVNKTVEAHKAKTYNDGLIMPGANPGGN